MLNAYERRLIFFYLSNAVPRLHRRTVAARRMAEWIFEHEIQLICQSSLITCDTAQDAIEYWWNKKEIPALKWRHLGEALWNEYTTTRKARPDRTAQRLRQLGRALRLSRTDTAILELLLRYSMEPIIESMVDDVFNHRRTRTFNCRNSILSCLLGLSANTFFSRFAPDAPLVASGLISIDDDGDVKVMDRLMRLAWSPPPAGSDVWRMLLDEASPGELCWSDFDHVADDRDHIERILKGALRNGETGVNVLIYGPPGTGKTEFCKTLAARLDASLYVVGESDDHGGEPSRHERLQELRLVQRLLTKDRQSLLLFDEMEDLLSDEGGTVAALFGFRRSPGRRAGGSKVFMNRLLEQTPVPTLWTSNAAPQTSPSLLRRMMFALELRQPPPRVRARIWTRQFVHHGIESDEEDARTLACEFDVTPGVAFGVTAAARLGHGSIDDVRRGVRSLSRLLSSETPPVQPATKKFDPTLIHTDVDSVRLVESLAGSNARQFSLCLQGPPGTGKSVFVRHLADRLGLEVVQKRASDLMSPFVGETEKEIAAAFAEARNAAAFLLFDEADSLLADRRLAVRNWEVSQVNEMLTWMESHPLPFACTTNFGDRLDPATLRRFTFKIALNYLSPEQATVAFRAYFGLAPPPEVADITALTPGDFAVVRQKAEILGCLNDPQVLVEMLRAECEAKPDRTRPLGFQR